MRPSPSGSSELIPHYDIILPNLRPYRLTELKAISIHKYSTPEARPILNSLMLWLKHKVIRIDQYVTPWLGISLIT